MHLFRLNENAPHSNVRIDYIHNGLSSRSGAYELKDKKSINIYIPRFIGASKVELQVFNEACSNIVYTIPGIWISTDYKHEIYTFELDEMGVGLYFSRIACKSISGDLYGYRDRNNLYFSTDERGNMLQLSVSDFKYDQPKDYYGGIIYHIFVDRFNRGARSVPQKNNAIMVDNWQSPIPEYPKYPGAPLKNDYFYGGTLYGIIEKLDYLKSLGVNLIYLSPIFSSCSNHKYDTANYMEIDSMFGGEEAFKELIKKAKDKQIGIILDGVFNHTGDDSIYFNRYGNYDITGAFQSKDSKFYSWYDFKSYPNKYVCWWGIDILPRINTNLPECKEYFVGKNGVIDHYSSLGVAGWRLDVADELSDEFIKAIKSTSYNAGRGNSIVYGEVWEDASNKIAYEKRKTYYLGDELDGVMNYPLRKGIISFLANHNSSDLEYALTVVLNNTPKRILDLQMNLLGTHDTLRILTALAGESPNNKSNDYLFSHRMSGCEYELGKTRLKLAYTILATLPGLPTIFYGDEVGVEGYSDPFNRTTFPWGNEDTDILKFYKLLGKVRRNNDLYKDGYFELIYLDDEVLIFKRHNNREALVTVINNSNKKICVKFSSKAKSLLSSDENREIVVPSLNGDIRLVSAKAKVTYDN